MNAPEGTLVIADIQTAGKGRLGRVWFSPEGGLWFSLILKPTAPDLSPLTVIFGACISRIIEVQTSLPCRFHWPNDLYINEKKVGGILLKSRIMGNVPQYAIAGVGINVNFPATALNADLSIAATTLLDERGTYTAITALLAGILNKLEKDYDEFLSKGPGRLIESYKSQCVTLGRRVKILNSGDIKEADGTAKDITPDGGLVVELFSGEKGILYNAERLILIG